MNTEIVNTKIRIKGKDFIVKSLPIGCDSIDIIPSDNGGNKIVAIPIKGFWKRLLNKIGHINLYGIRIYKLHIQWSNYRSKYFRVVTEGPKYFFRVFVVSR